VFMYDLKEKEPKYKEFVKELLQQHKKPKKIKSVDFETPETTSIDMSTTQTIELCSFSPNTKDREFKSSKNGINTIQDSDDFSLDSIEFVENEDKGKTTDDLKEENSNDFN